MLPLLLSLTLVRKDPVLRVQDPLREWLNKPKVALQSLPMQDIRMPRGISTWLIRLLDLVEGFTNQDRPQRSTPQCIKGGLEETEGDSVGGGIEEEVEAEVC